ncbi:START domain-containing protein [Dyadobacter luticola]|uniref:START domain-containing protein n=1 Tax=Dyadobacter luticola TaxID=1979387 RepID=UPI001E5101B1|nr:START domain-containing protein [Dyadobacter luticola]
MSEAFAQDNWKLVTKKEEITVYSQEVPGSKIKALRVECVVDVPLMQVAALLLDVEGGTDWVYKTKSCTMIRKVSPTEMYYHSEIDLPWPLDNRDFVAHVKASQNPVSKVITIEGPVVSGMVPEKKGIVRVSDSKGHWVVSPLSPGKSKIQYWLHTDPGGSIPAWAVNAFAAEGPIESFKKLKEQVKLPKYRNVKFSFK